MTDLFLTRHGETLWNTQKRFQGWKNSPLTEKGIYQGIRLSRVVKNEGIEIIYTSPLERAFATAISAKGDMDIPVVVLDELMELSLGEWEGKTYEELKAEDSENFKVYWSSPIDYIPRGGESYEELTERSRKAVSLMLKESRGKKILAVTHGMTLMTLIHVLTGKDLSDILLEDVLPQTSVTLIRIDDRDGNSKGEIIKRGCMNHFDEGDNSR